MEQVIANVYGESPNKLRVGLWYARPKSWPILRLKNRKNGGGGGKVGEIANRGKMRGGKAFDRAGP